MLEYFVEQSSASLASNPATYSSVRMVSFGILASAVSVVAPKEPRAVASPPSTRRGSEGERWHPVGRGLRCWPESNNSSVAEKAVRPRSGRLRIAVDLKRTSARPFEKPVDRGNVEEQRGCG